MKFSEILRVLISEKNITQKQLAAELRIPVSTLGGYVQGTSEPDFFTLKLLASYFGVTTDFLLDYRIGKTESPEEDELLRVFRCLDNNQRDVFIDQGKAFLKHNLKK